MSTIAGKGSEDEGTVRKYQGCGWDGYCDEEDFYSDSRPHGYYKDGVWYPPGTIVSEAPKEITYTAEELKAIRRRFSSEKTIISHLREKSEMTDELFRYIDYISQEFKKLQKTYDDTKEEVARLRRTAYYFVFVNEKNYYMCEYDNYDYITSHSIYISKRIGLKYGDIVTGFNSNTQVAFNFLGGLELEEGISDADFEMLPQGLLCKKDGIYDIQIILEYGKDVVRVRRTTNEFNKFEVAKDNYKRSAKVLLNFMKSVTKLHDSFSNILDRGSKIDPSNLSKALKCWQCLDRIVEFEIYEPYEKKVIRYGTSY